MYYIKEENENGEFVKNGTRYSVRGVNRACTPQGDNVGYTLFNSEKEMLAAWGLIKIPPDILLAMNAPVEFSTKNEQPIK